MNEAGKEVRGKSKDDYAVPSAIKLGNIVSGILNFWRDQDWRAYFPILTGLIGAVLGVLVFMYAGWAEGEKKIAQQKVIALTTIAEFAWGGESPSELLSFTQKLSGLTIFGDSEIIRQYAAYQASPCPYEKEPTFECGIAWAKVVNAMRVSVNQPAVPKEWIVQILWGDLKQKTVEKPPGSPTAPVKGEE